MEGIYFIWKERKKIGGEYSSRYAAGYRYVVVCISNFSVEYIMDFFIEFYVNRKLEVLVVRFKKKEFLLLFILYLVYIKFDLFNL